MTDRPIENPLFYTDSAERCQAWIDDLTAQAAPPQDPSDVLAGIVPHAGWSYSGAVAAQVWKHLQVRSKPEVIIIFGAVHYPGAPRNAAYPGGAWSSPLGPVPVDGNLADTLRKQLDTLLDVDASAHAQEHSIEVQIPFVRALFPDTRILPIAVPPGSQSAALGTRVAEVTTDLPVIAVGSTDLTHYGDRYRFAPAGSGTGAHEWMLANDRRMLDLMVQVQPDTVVAEAREHRNACGSGAIAATLAFARQRGRSNGELLCHTTSHDVEGKPTEAFDMAVGYAGMVF